MFLNSSDTLDIFNILIKIRVDRHALRSHGKTFFMFVLICDANHKRDTRRILFHHFKHETNSQMNPFDNQ